MRSQSQASTLSTSSRYASHTAADRPQWLTHLEIEMGSRNGGVGIIGVIVIVVVILFLVGVIKV